MQPTTIQLTADKIEMTISGIEYSIERTLFEDWLTEGTGIVTSFIGDKETTDTLDEYWALTKEVNDTDAKAHIGEFLASNEGKGDLLRINKAATMEVLMSYLPMDGLEALRAYNQAYHEYMEYYAS